MKINYNYIESLTDIEQYIYFVRVDMVNMYNLTWKETYNILISTGFYTMCEDKTLHECIMHRDPSHWAEDEYNRYIIKESHY